ncbi:MAG: peptidase M10A and M12B matrixin and adamalysin [Haloferacaceae archaeon]
MKRRQFLASVGLSSLGVFALRERTETPLRVTVWATERAADYDALPARAVGYLGAALRAVDGRITVDYGGRVRVSTERAYDLVAGGEWPAVLAAQTATGRARVGDVNLLVTDGEMAHAPTGMGVPYVAAVGGARFVARMPPAAESSAVLAYSYPAFVTQVLLHECGHALGLRHRDGSVGDSDGAAVVSPMVSAYAWADDADREEHFGVGASACGATATVDGDRERRLRMRYSPCATERLRESEFLLR